jgi:hypothetical protein
MDSYLRSEIENGRKRHQAILGLKKVLGEVTADSPSVSAQASIIIEKMRKGELPPNSGSLQPVVELARLIKDPIDRVQGLLNVANVFHVLGAGTLVTQYQEEAVQVAVKISEPAAKERTIDNVIKHKMILERFDEAEKLVPLLSDPHNRKTHQSLRCKLWLGRVTGNFRRTSIDLRLRSPWLFKEKKIQKLCPSYWKVLWALLA